MKFLNFFLILLISSFTFPKALVVGDSNSCYSGGWQDQLRYDYEVTNISKGGKRTAWMLSQLKKMPVDSFDYVFIAGGINDAYSWVSIHDAVSNVQSMVDIVDSCGKQPVVLVGYSWRANTQTWIKDKKLELFHQNRNRMLQNQMDSCLKNCIVVPAIDLTRDQLFGDGIHPKLKAHKIIYREVCDRVK
jgi:lysophospholipase L1-like esterase